MQPPLWEEVLRAVNSGQQPTEEQWQALTPDEQALIESLQKEKLTANSVEFLDRIDENKAWDKLTQQVTRTLPGRTIRMRFLKYAAIFAGVLVLGASAIFLVKVLRSAYSPATVIAGTYITTPVDPQRATLVLADGRRVELDKTPESRIRQGQAEITHADTALLRYTAGAGAITPAGFNTLTIPRGGKYKIELADGTEVWLNAETQLRYPAHFGGVTQREVFLESGEAYFKVRHDVKLPFIVRAGGMDIQVLGTEFNINTYTANYATTLVNGSVKLSAGAAVTMLQPGQQGLYAGGGFARRPVDVETYIAWKDGQMIYEEAALEEVMNNLGRQYDLTVEFTSPELKTLKFGGRLRRTQHIEDVLTVIEKAGNVGFSIRGRTIFVVKALSK